LGENIRSAHSARRRAWCCAGDRCRFGTETHILPWLTIVSALRASGVQYRLMAACSAAVGVSIRYAQKRLGLPVATAMCAGVTKCVTWA
jgi:hypothetical protein